MAGGQAGLSELRAVLQSLIEVSLTILDATAPDPDLEGDEPEAGEDGRDPDLDEDLSDLEPSLGATEHINQEIGWLYTYPSSFHVDCEDEHVGREPEGFAQ
jgi:hypothetical protein